MMALWQESLAALDEEAARGANLFGQSMPRTFDINIRLSETSFLLYGLPAWNAIMRLPQPERLAAFGDPARREELRDHSALLGPLLYILHRRRDDAARTRPARAARSATSPASAACTRPT